MYLIRTVFIQIIGLLVGLNLYIPHNKISYHPVGTRGGNCALEK